LIEREALFLSHSPQESRRKFDEQTATIAGFSVRSDGAPVGQPDQRIDRRLNYPVTRQVIEIRYQAKSATVSLELRVVQGFCCLLCHRGREERAKAFLELRF
jgi:polyphosphate kinase